MFESLVGLGLIKYKVPVHEFKEIKLLQWGLVKSKETFF